MAQHTAHGDLADYDFSQAVRYHHGAFPPKNLDLAQLIPTAPDSDPFVLVITRLDRVIQSHKNQCLPLWIARSSRAMTMKGAVIRKDRWYYRPARKSA